MSGDPPTPLAGGTVLVVDDDRTIREIVRRSLEKAGAEVRAAETAAEGLAALQQGAPDVLLLDIMLPDRSGLDVFQDVRGLDRRLPVVFITAGADSASAIAAMQLGAFDYVAKPLDLPGLTRLVATALETRRLMSRPVALALDEKAPPSAEAFVGQSSAIIDVFKTIGRVAKQDVTVLIRGESGAGKELVARALYQHSARAAEPFLAVNCAALPEQLLESELFGHEKGAFTGADRRRIGKFEQLSGGTIFLDEIGDMSPLVQGKVLRVLQEQRFERVGGNETIETDVRLVAATNRPLEEMVAKGEFRDDLLYRLNGVTIRLPPLRERREDIPLLIQHVLAIARDELEKPGIEGVSPEALERLTRYGWPGNVRELQAVVRQAVLNATGPVIAPAHLPESLRPAPGGGAEPAPAARHSAGAGPDPVGVAELVEASLQNGGDNVYAEALEQFERYLFTRVLQETGGNQSRAAEVLGVTRGKVRDRIKSFGISVQKQVTQRPAD